MLFRSTLTDVISGLTLNLQAEDLANPATISVTRDNTTVKEGVSNFVSARSEERRVGKECRSRWSP